MSIQIKLGTGKFDNKPIIWDSSRVINPHWSIIGSSGTGKTYRILDVIRQMTAYKVRILVFDCQGDIATSPDNTDSVVLSESTGYGLNPLKVQGDKESGGVRRQASAFMSMINRYSPNKLGVKQMTALKNLITDLYAANGIYQDKVDTWSGRRSPNMGDLKRFAHYKLKTLYIFGSDMVTDMVEVLCKKMIGLNKKVDKQAKSDEDEIDELKEECKEAFCEFIDELKTGREVDEIIKYESKEVMKSVYMRVDYLSSLSIFRDRSIELRDDKKIWRFDIKSLSHEEQGYFVESYLREEFYKVKGRGLNREPHTYIILDEAQKYFSNESDHIINIIAREGRKYGLGVIFATQNFGNFPEAVITNSGTKLILGADEANYDVLAKKLGIERKKLSYIRPRQTACVQIKRHDDRGVENRFMDVVFG